MKHKRNPLQTCCFTGHRPNKMPWKNHESDPRCIDLKQRLFDTVMSAYQCGMRHFICGMAMGCDLYFSEAVIALRNEASGVTLEAAIPCENQFSSWPADTCRRYFELISQCDYETLLQSEYTPDCMMRRNYYMVDQSQLLIAVYNGFAGGTRNTILYAMRQNLDIIELPIEAVQHI